VALIFKDSHLEQVKEENQGKTEIGGGDGIWIIKWSCTIISCLMDVKVKKLQIFVVLVLEDWASMSKYIVALCISTKTLEQ